MRYTGLMYGHQLEGDLTGLKHGLTAAYDIDNAKMSDLALFMDRAEAQEHADRIGKQEGMEAVKVVAVRVTLEVAIFGLKRVAPPTGPLSVQCPLCHSGAGLPCVTRGGHTCDVHQARIKAAGVER